MNAIIFVWLAMVVDLGAWAGIVLVMLKFLG
jgi:hypothetical protein